MLKSMTGFGRCEALIEGFDVKIQIKSVNHRYSDFTIKAPRYYTFLEEKLRALAMGEIARGKVEILLSLDRKDSDDKVITLDRPVAEGYLGALRALGEYGLTDDLTVSALAGFHDIFHIEYKDIDEELILRIVSAAFQQALDEFMEMRRAEGARLEASLRRHLEDLLSQVAAVEKRSPECVDAYRERLRARLEEVLSDTSIEESRILTEAAVFADKIAVDEETVRLRSHVKAFETAMTAAQPIGKKLDFIVQEMNREANTIGSKAQDVTLARVVVDIKAEIEKIREQILHFE